MALEIARQQGIRRISQRVHADRLPLEVGDLGYVGTGHQIPSDPLRLKHDDLERSASRYDRAHSAPASPAVVDGAAQQRGNSGRPPDRHDLILELFLSKESLFLGDIEGKIVNRR